MKIYTALKDSEIIASAMIVIDKTILGLSTWDIARGPIGSIDNGKLIIDNLLQYILQNAKKNNCMSIYYTPQNNYITNCKSLLKYSFNSPRHQQPTATRIINLQQTEEEILAQMKPKGRYNIRVAKKHEVKVKKSQDIDSFFELIKETSIRDKFNPLPKNHYKKFLNNLDNSFMFLAFNQNKKPIAGLMGVVWNGTGIYYYGASSHNYKALMAPYALQWQAMQYCKKQKCTNYDLFGISPPNAPKDHPWRGITNFKEKFGGEIKEYPKEKIFILKPIIYKLIELKRNLNHK